MVIRFVTVLNFRVLKPGTHSILVIIFYYYYYYHYYIVYLVTLFVAQNIQL
jgi:hypothetical protein